MEYKVSVIVPVYNAEKTLERAFSSVKNQTIGFENIELLLCDDCSTDNSFSIIQEWEKQYENVRAFKTKKNSGMAGAPRNVCLENVSAPYVMFLDNDDEFFDYSVKSLYCAITENKADIASGDWTQVADGKKETHRHEAEYGVKNADIFASNEAAPFIGTVWRTIFKSEIIRNNKIRMPESSREEDIAFTMEYLMFCKKGVYINESVYNWLRRSGSVSLSQAERKPLTQTLISAGSYEEVVEREKSSGLTGAAERCFKLYGDPISTAVDELLYTDTLNDEELKEFLLSWKRLLIFHAKNSYSLVSPGAAVLANDFLNSTDENAVENFFELRKLYHLRQQELDGIFGSATWKAASLLQKLKIGKK